MTAGLDQASHGVVQEAFQRLRAAQDSDNGLPVVARQMVLRGLRRRLVADAEAYVAAIDADFGRRSRHETLLSEVALAIAAIDYAVPRIKRWSRPSRVVLGFPYWPARASLIKQPRGLVGLIGPSNYPIQLTLVPLINALAAGCRVILKPSEATPRVTALLARGLEAALGRDVIAVIEGGSEVAEALTKLPLDLLFFTGSSEIGGKVSAAAAARLTPAVLELGGKSPVVLDPSADLDRAARAILGGKLLNAGQTCVAPDYLLVPAKLYEPMIVALKRVAAQLYPDARDLTALRSQAAAAHIERLSRGQQIVDLLPFAVEPPLTMPKLVLSPDLDSPIMREEIFGPLLPILPYESIEAAIAIIRARPEPLALYWFGETDHSFRRLIESTRSGSISVNETVIHAGLNELPFGGIGASGVGRYHGKAGFDTFTHERPVFRQSRFNLPNMLRPPYGRLAERILGSLIR